MITVDQYEYIRTAYRSYDKKIREIAKETGHSRNTVRKALRKEYIGYSERQNQPYPILGPYLKIIDNWLEQDKDKPKKQRHTGTRIYNRLKSEKSYKIDFIISDAKNNISKLRVYAKGATSIKAFPQEKFTKLLNWETENIYENSGIQIKFPKNSFYTDLKFNYSVKKDSNFCLFSDSEDIS